MLHPASSHLRRDTGGPDWYDVYIARRVLYLYRVVELNV
jgi:hypothetical protein